VLKKLARTRGESREQGLSTTNAGALCDVGLSLYRRARACRPLSIRSACHPGTGSTLACRVIVMGKRGRRPQPKAERLKRSQEARRLLADEMAKSPPDDREQELPPDDREPPDDHKQARKNAIARVAGHFKVSTRTIERWLATPQPEESWVFTTSLQTRYRINAKINKLHPYATPQERAYWQKRYQEEISQETTVLGRWRRLFDED
jgi:hypothetical protein